MLQEHDAVILKFFKHSNHLQQLFKHSDHLQQFRNNCYLLQLVDVDQPGFTMIQKGTIPSAQKVSALVRPLTLAYLLF